MLTSASGSALKLATFPVPQAAVYLRAEVKKWLRGDEALLRDASHQLQQQSLMLRAGMSTLRMLELAPFKASGRGRLARELEKLYRCIEIVAVRSGASWASALDALEVTIASLIELRRRRRVLATGPKSSMILISVLPIVALLLGEILGFAPLAVLFSPGGWVLIVIGLCALLGGVKWQQKMLARTLSQEGIVGFECELMALALAGGVPIGAARKCVIDAIVQSGSEWLSCDEFVPGGIVAAALRTAEVSSTGVSDILLLNAKEKRRGALAELEEAAEKLAAKLLLPMTLCILPAFVVLGIVPIIMSMFEQWF